MVLTVTAVPGGISTAINTFNAGYHADYFMVRCLARAYLAAPPSAVTTMPLASALNGVLLRWGAGKRGAPTCQLISNMAAALIRPNLHLQLRNLEACIPFLTIIAGRRCLAAGAPFAAVTDFDSCLIDTLSTLSTGLLVGNTNVTYPMKLLLLLTGLMPAFDSQVKGGLASAGVTGINRTRYLIPVLGSADAQKICALPLYMADCIARQLATINHEIAASLYPNLVGEHGRIFDVLFFMQNGGHHVTVSFTPPVAIRWYAI